VTSNGGGDGDDDGDLPSLDDTIIVPLEYHNCSFLTLYDTEKVPRVEGRGPAAAVPHRRGY
jgi:hypothetical protein